MKAFRLLLAASEIGKPHDLSGLRKNSSVSVLCGSLSGRPSMLERESPPSAEDNAPYAAKTQNAVIIDHQCNTSNLDEIEHLSSTLVSPNRLVSLSRDGSADAGFRFHGTSHFGAFYVRYGRTLAVDLQPHDADDRLAFVVPTRGVGQLHLGRKDWEATPQQGVIFTSGPPRVLDYREDCETLAIVLDRRKIAEFCAKLMGRDIKEGVEFDPLFSLDGAGGQNWLRLANYGAAELSNPQSFVRSLPAARQQLEQMMITGFLLAHAHNYSHALLQPQAAAAPYYVKRAEAYIEAHFAEPLSLAEIAAQSGVGARSLQNGFKGFRNMTPMAFLRSVRLQHAHRALVNADPVITTVTDVAMSCGFGHLGEFASLYKRTFGEAPSQTLSRTAKA